VCAYAGRPRSDPFFDSYEEDKLDYRKGVRIRERDEKLFYTNDLHDVVLKKQGKVFWHIAGDPNLTPANTPLSMSTALLILTL